MKIQVVITLNKQGDISNIQAFEDKKQANDITSKINIAGEWATIADIHEVELIKKDLG